MIIHILIVDDNKDIRHFLTEFLEAKKYQCTSADSAEAALEVLKTNTVQVVVTDIVLPGLSGLDLAKKIKETYETVDVIVMTGHGREFSYEKAVEKGASDMVVKPFRPEELQLRIERTLAEQKLRMERKIIMEELNRLAITDDLTKLFNARHFYQRLKDEINRARRYRAPLSLLLLDIDFFKKYNDQYGHQEGNEVLRQLGKTIQSCLRSMDSAYRYGGEEFTVILPQTSCCEAETVAHRIRESVEKLIFVPRENEKVTITISIGVAEYLYGEDNEAFVKKADKAMYLSKNSGRNRVTTLPAPVEPSDFPAQS